LSLNTVANKSWEFTFIGLGPNNSTPEPPNLAAAAEFCALAGKKIRLSQIASIASAAEKLFGFLV